MSPEAYDLHDGRFLEEVSTTSGANGSGWESAPVPAGRVRTILTAAYYPSAAETRTVYFSVRSKTGNYFPIMFPVAIALGPTVPLPALTDGMEIKLFPGEKLAVQRDVATAGTTMTLIYRFIDTDLPYYSYEEPQKKVVAQVQRHGSVYRSTGGIAQGRTAGEITRGEREPGGRPEPV